MKEEEVLNLAKKFEFNANEAFPLKDEASGREYWRISSETESKILCYLNPSKGNHGDFIKISESLLANNVDAVKVFHHDEKMGVTIQEDLGHEDLIKIFNDDNKDSLIKKSLDLLVSIQQSNIEKISKFSIEELRNQMNLFKASFCKDFLNIDPDKSLDRLIDSVCSNIQNQSWKNCHFDFERRNLILNKHGTISVIDYQDMRIGPIGIDLSGILVDHYYPYEENNVKEYLCYYADISGIKDISYLFEALKWGCIQRNLRILGTLTDLYVSQNRNFRLKDLPLILENTIAISSDENFMTDFFEEILHALKLKMSSL